MKGKRFKEEQIISILKEWDAGGLVKDLCRKYAVSDATLYTWKRKFGGMEVSDAKKLRALEDENRKLKRIVADQSLDLMALKDIVSGKI